MASRRAQPRPQLPQIRTQVTAAPVNTAVTPGNAGAPVAPVAPLAPLEANTQEATDLQNLSSAFGGLSQSLQQFGTATARKAAAEISFLKQQGREKEAKERRDAYDRRMAAGDLRTAERKLEQEINSQAKEASELIDIEKSMKDRRVDWFKGASEAKYSLYNSPGFRTKLSELLGRRAAKLTYNEAYWTKFFENQDNALHEMGSAGKLFDARTAELVKQGLSFVGDKNAYQANFLAERSIFRAKIVNRQEQFLGNYVQEEEEEAAVAKINEIVSSPEPPAQLPPIAAGQGVPDSPNDYGGPSGAEQLTGLLDNLRGTHLQPKANEFMGKTLIDAALNSTDIDSFERALDFFEKVKTGPPGSRTLLSKVPANINLRTNKNDDIERKRLVLTRQRRSGVFETFSSQMKDVVGSELTAGIKASENKGRTINRLIANLELLSVNPSNEWGKLGIKVEVSGNTVSMNMPGVEKTLSFNLDSLYASSQIDTLRTTRRSIASANKNLNIVEAETQAVLSTGVESSGILQEALKKGADIAREETTDVDSKEVQEGYKVWSTLENNKRLRDVYVRPGSFEHDFYSAIDAIKRTPLLEELFAADEPFVTDTPRSFWDKLTRTFAEKQNWRDSYLATGKESPLAPVSDLLSKELEKGNISVNDFTKVKSSAFLVAILIEGQNARAAVNAAMEANDRSKQQVTVGGRTYRIRPMPQEVFNGTNSTLASASFVGDSALTWSEHASNAVKTLTLDPFSFGPRDFPNNGPRVKQLIDLYRSNVRGAKDEDQVSIKIFPVGSEGLRFQARISYQTNDTVGMKYSSLDLTLEDIATLSGYYQRQAVVSVPRKTYLSKDRPRYDGGKGREAKVTIGPVSPINKSYADREKTKKLLAASEALRKTPSIEEALTDRHIWTQAPVEALNIRWGMLTDQLSVFGNRNQRGLMLTRNELSGGENARAPGPENVKRLKKLNEALAQTQDLIMQRSRSAQENALGAWTAANTNYDSARSQYYSTTRRKYVSEDIKPSKVSRVLSGTAPSASLLRGAFPVGESDFSGTPSTEKFNDRWYRQWWAAYKEQANVLISLSGQPRAEIKIEEDDIVDGSLVPAKRGQWNRELWGTSTVIQEYMRNLLRTSDGRLWTGHEPAPSVGSHFNQGEIKR